MSIPIRNITPFLHVKSVPASIEFYERLGFRVGNTHAMEGSTEPVWAWLRTDDCSLMVGQAGEPVIADMQAVIFWMYVDDVAAKREELKAAGIEVGEIDYPFWNRRGEFRVKDPDGYDLMIAHT